MALWTPALITTALWLDAADSDTITLDGSSLIQINDKSGNEAHATVPSGATAPLYDISTGIQLAIGSKLRTGLVTWPEKMTLLVVAKRAASGMTDTHRLINVNANNRFYMGLRNNLFNATHGTGFGFSGLAAAVPNRNPTDFSVMGTVRHDYTSTGSNPLFNGEVLNAVPGGTASGNFTLEIGGLDLSGFTTQDWVGGIKEVVLLPSDDVELRQKSEGYLAWKCGIEANLLGGHPYENAAPTTAPLVFFGYYGTTRDKDGALAERRVIATLDSTGECVANILSDPVTGEYEIVAAPDTPHTLIFTGEADRNALVYTGVMPEEIP